MTCIQVYLSNFCSGQFCAACGSPCGTYILAKWSPKRPMQILKNRVFWHLLLLPCSLTHNTQTLILLPHKLNPHSNTMSKLEGDFLLTRSTCTLTHFHVGELSLSLSLIHKDEAMNFFSFFTTQYQDKDYRA